MAVNALYLDNWTVETVDRSQEGYRLVARYDVEPDHCPKCGSTRQPYRHGPRAIDYVDAPVHGQRTVVAVDVQRYRCRDCSATFMQPLPDMDPQRRMTQRCADHIREQGLIRPYAHLAREIGLDEKTIRDICNEEIEALLARHKPVAPVALGIDELHLLGRKRTIFTDVGERRILDLIESMNRPQVDRWLSLLEDRKRIRIVTIDMWGPYREAVQALLPDAVIISDKWHVQSKANAALDENLTAITEAHPASGCYVCRGDFETFAIAEAMAAKATAFSGKLHIATDAGSHSWPRYDVVKMHEVGDPVSFSFNGDSYPCGHVVRVSPTLGVITARDEAGTERRFARIGKTGSWREGGTWFLARGHQFKQNPHL